MITEAKVTTPSRVSRNAGDDDTIAEVVDAVAEQHAPAATPGLLLVEMVMVVVTVALVMVRVAGTARPSGEKKNQPAEQGSRTGVTGLAALSNASSER